MFLEHATIWGYLVKPFIVFKEAHDEGGVEALLDKPHRKPNLKNCVYEQIEQAVCQYALDYPAHGQTRASNELRLQGTFVSSCGIHSIWLRNNFENLKKRLKKGLF